MASHSPTRALGSIAETLAYAQNRGFLETPPAESTPAPAAGDVEEAPPVESTSAPAAGDVEEAPASLRDAFSDDEDSSSGYSSDEWDSEEEEVSDGDYAEEESEDDADDGVEVELSTVIEALVRANATLRESMTILAERMTLVQDDNDRLQKQLECLAMENMEAVRRHNALHSTIFDKIHLLDQALGDMQTDVQRLHDDVEEVEATQERAAQKWAAENAATKETCRVVTEEAFEDVVRATARVAQSNKASTLKEMDERLSAFGDNLRAGVENEMASVETWCEQELAALAFRAEETTAGQNQLKNRVETVIDRMIGFEQTTVEDIHYLFRVVDDLPDLEDDLDEAEAEAEAEAAAVEERKEEALLPPTRTQEDEEKAALLLSMQSTQTPAELRPTVSTEVPPTSSAWMAPVATTGAW